MAGGPDDDDKTAGHHVSGPIDGQPDAHTADPHPRSTDVFSPSATSPASEWTVSDRRGPLNAAAAPLDDVERFVPGSEMDAEGAHDSTMSHPGASGSVVPETATSISDPHHTGSTEPAAATATTLDPEQTPEHVLEPVGAEGHGPTSSETGPAATPAPRRSIMPLAAAVVIGALLGAGSAALVYMQVAGPAAQGVDPRRLAALSTRVDDLEKRPDPQPALAKMQGQVDDLGRKVAALEKQGGGGAPPQSVPGAAAASPASKTAASTSSAPAPSASAPSASAPSASAPAPSQASAPVALDATALNAKIAALQASVDALQKQGASRDLTGKLEALQAALTSVQTLASSARTNVDTLKSQQQAFDGKLGDLQSAVGSAQKQASAAQSGVDGLQTEQKSLAGKLGAPALAVVADSLVTQVASGRPYATQVDALASLGADPVKVALLRQNASSGVPSAQTLLSKFAPLVTQIVATGSKAPPNANFGERLKHGLFGLVNVRRTDVTTGNDLPSRVALIQADLSHDDVADAYAVWTALPADAKQVSDAWGASAKTSVEAITAARGLQSQSIGSLAAKKS